MAFNWKEYDRYEEALMNQKARRRKSEGVTPGIEMYAALIAVIAVPVIAFILQFRPNLLDFSKIDSEAFLNSLAVGTLIGAVLSFRRKDETVREEEPETAETEEFTSAQYRAR